MIRVRNIPTRGTAIPLDVWKHFSRQEVHICPAISCINTELVAARVQHLNGNDSTIYIYPLCTLHEQEAQELFIDDRYLLLPESTLAEALKPH